MYLFFFLFLFLCVFKSTCFILVARVNLFQFLYPRSPKGEGYTFYLCPSVLLSFILPSFLPSVQDIFRRIFLSNCWWQKSDIWSQASYRYPISWEAFLDPSDSYFLFADFVDFHIHWTYMLIFRRIFLSNYWCQKSDIWSQASYRYPISWEAFFDPSDSYFLFAKERRYHRWALAHSSSCLTCINWISLYTGHEKLVPMFSLGKFLWSLK
jgi:hypothetical protein